MKLILLILSGLAMSLVAFAGGVLTTIIFLTAEPQQDRSLSVESSGLWTTAPARVNPGVQGVERVPARPGIAAAATEAASSPVTQLDSEVDATVTGAIATEASAQPLAGVNSMINDAHVTWCSKRFRSYRSADNSYRPYGGGRRSCISPYMETVDALAPSAGDTATYAEDPAESLAPVEFASDEEPSLDYLTPEHVDSCFSRYRSYRPQDNTYQPYSGGPRRQCE